MPTSRCLLLVWTTALLASALPSYSEESQKADLTGLHIALDVGHSLTKPGAISARGRIEFLFNQSTAKVIAQVLRTAGAKVTIINGL